MQLLGELERWVANTVYPWRVPLAVVLVVAGGVLAVYLARRGVLGAARERVRARPLLSGATLVIGLVIAGPALWYLASPIWTRTALEESLVALPVAAAGPSGAASGAMSTSESGATSGPAGGDVRLIGRGEIAGADAFHFGRGRAELIAVEGAHVLQVREFSVRNGPDLYVYLSSSGTRPDAGAVQLGRLKATDGEFRYDLPPGTVLPPNPHFLVWCEQFAVLFASARLAEGT